MKQLIAVGSQGNVLSVGLIPNASIAPETAVAAMRALIDLIEYEMSFDIHLTVRFCLPQNVGPVEPLSPREEERRATVLQAALEIGEQIRLLGDPA